MRRLYNNKSETLILNRNQSSDMIILVPERIHLLGDSSMLSMFRLADE